MRFCTWLKPQPQLDPGVDADVQKELFALRVQSCNRWCVAAIAMTAYIALSQYLRYGHYGFPMWMVLTGTVLVYALALMVLLALHHPSRRFASLLTFAGSICLTVCLAWRALDVESMQEIDGRERLRAILKADFDTVIPQFVERTLDDDDALVRLLGANPVEFIFFVILNSIQSNFVAQTGRSRELERAEGRAY